MRNRTLDEASVTSMINGFLSTQKENMLKRNKSGANKKLQKFWSNINESVSLLEARDVMAMHPQTNQFEPATVVGATPSSSGTVFKVQWKDASLGEPVVLPGNKIQFERAATGGPEEDVMVKDPKGLGFEKASLIGQVPTKDGMMARVIMREPGASMEPILVPMSRIKKVGQNKWAPKQSMAIGAKKSKDGPRLHDEVDPQAAPIADKMTEKLPSSEEGVKELVDRRAADEKAEKTGPISPVVKEKASGSMKQAMSGEKLRQLTNKKLVGFINSDPEFAVKWSALREKIRSQDKDIAKAAATEMQSIRASIANKILGDSNASKRNATDEKLAGNKGGSEERKRKFLSVVSKKFLDGVAPDIAAGKFPKPELAVMAKAMFGIEFKKPSDVAKLMKILGGQTSAAPEAVARFVDEFASKSEQANAFASAKLDTFPGNFVDKIEKIANKQNIPSQYERQMKGEFGGIGQGVKKISLPQSTEARPGQELKASQKLQNSMASKIDPEKVKDIEGAAYSRSKVGSTPVDRAAQELPIDEIAKLFNYFNQNKDEVARAQAERSNKSDSFSKGKLAVPGSTGDFDEEAMLGTKSGASIRGGSVSAPSVLDKSEQKRLQDEAAAKKAEFKKGAQKRLSSQMSQEEDDVPVASGPDLAPSPKNIPAPKNLWSRIVNINVDNNPFARKLISAAAKTFKADEEDVEAVLNVLLKTDQKGNVVGLRDPNKEAVQFDSDEQGNILRQEDIDLAQKLFYSLNPGRLQTKQDGKKTEEERQLAPAFEEYGKAAADAAISLPSLDKHISRVQSREEKDKAAKEQELARLRSPEGRMSPEEMESLNYELDMRRAKVGAAIRNHIASLRDETGALTPETAERFGGLIGRLEKLEKQANDTVDINANYRHSLDMLDEMKPFESEWRASSDPESTEKLSQLENFRKFVNAMHDVIPKDPYIPGGTVRTTPHSRRGIDKPTGKLVHPKFPDVDFEKQPKIKDFLGMKTTTSKPTNPDEADPKKALAKYKAEEDAGVDKKARSVVAGRYGFPGNPAPDESKESGDEVKNRRLSNILSAAKKHVAKQKEPLTVSSIARSMKRIIQKNDKYKDLAGVKIDRGLLGELGMKTKKKESESTKEPVKESKTPVHKLSLFEFLTVPGKKTLTHAEAKEKDWDKSNPVMKKKFEPKFDKQKKPSASKKKGC